MVRLAKWTGLSLLTVLVIVMAGVAWLASGMGLPFVMAQAERFVTSNGGELHTEGLSGSLYSGVAVEQLRWSDGSTTVAASQLATAWSLGGLLQRKLVIGESSIGALRITLPPTDPAAPAAPRQDVPMPGSWQLPVALDVARLRIDRLVVSVADASGRQGANSSAVAPPAEDGGGIVVRDLALAARYADGVFAVSDLALKSPWGDISAASARVADTAPHAVQLNARIEGAVPAVGRPAEGGQSRPQDANPPRSATAGANRSTDDRGYVADLTVTGDLATLTTGLMLRALDASVALRATVSPLLASPLRAADLDLKGLALQRLAGAAPAALLDAQLRLRTDPAAGAPDGRWRLELTADNADAGALDRGRIPVRQAKLLAFVDDPLAARLARIDIEQLAVQLAGTNQPADLTGSIGVQLDESLTVAGIAVPVTNASLQVRQLDLSVFGLPAQRTAMSGPIRIDRDRFEIALMQTADALAQQPAESAVSAQGLSLVDDASLQVTGKVTRDQVLLEQALLRLGPASVSAKGEARLVTPFAVTLTGGFDNIDLQRWVPDSPGIDSRWRDGSLAGTWRVGGELAPALDARLTLALVDSSFAGKAVAADINTVVRRNAAGADLQIEDLNAVLRWGTNRLTASGALGRAADRTALSLQLSDPSLIDPRADGALMLDGSLAGRFDALRATFDATGDRLRWRDGDASIDLASLTVKGSVPLTAAPSRDASLGLDVSARSLRAGDIRVDRFGARLDGSLAAHRFQANVSSDAGRLALAMNGGATLGDRPVWQGFIDRLAVDAQVDVGNETEIALTITPEQIVLNDAVLRIDAAGSRDGRVRIDALIANLVPAPAKRAAAPALPSSPALTPPSTPAVAASPDRAAPPFAIRGSVERLPVADMLAALSGNALPAELQRMRLSSRFDLQGSGPADLDGSLALDLTEVSGNGPSLLANANNEARLRFDAGRIDGTVDITLPSLAFSRGFTGPDWQLDGTMSLEGSLGGTLASPQWNAALTGRDLSLLQPALGWKLDAGQLQARIEGRQIRLQTLSLRTGQGTVALEGEARLLDTPQQVATANELPLRGTFRLRTDGFIVPIGPGQQLVLSGASRIVAADSGLSWEGDMTVDRGLIEIAGSGAPSLPDDVEIIDSSQPAAPEPGPTGGRQPGDEGIAVMTSLGIDLGKDLRVLGGGVNARLEGKLQLQGTLPAEPRVEGTVNIVDGSYTAYSQDLQITTGTVRFNGPIDNPSLSIEAERPNLPVEVGVAIRGTALSPRVELYSVPALTDAEKLSWLVLGQPIANAQGGAQSLALREAASRLIGSDDGSISGGGFADKLGLDNLGFGFASDTGQTEGVRDSGQPTGLPGAGGRSSQDTYREVVSLGKRLSDRLTVSYEQGVRGVYNLLRVQYELNKRLSLRAQTGTESAIDLLYFWSFD